MTQDPNDIIKALRLETEKTEIFSAHREVFRSVVKTEATKQRRAANSILFLMKKKTQSKLWYRMVTDEIFTYHSGTPLRLELIDRDGHLYENIVGADIMSGEIPMFVVPGWTWRRLSIMEPSEHDAWGLFGSITVPAFDVADYKEATHEEIAASFPELMKN